MTPEFAAFLGQFGLPITILVVLGITGARKIWVWGRELDNERAEKELARKERDEWKSIALKALSVTDKTLSVAGPNE